MGKAHRKGILDDIRRYLIEARTQRELRRKVKFLNSVTTCDNCGKTLNKCKCEVRYCW